MGLLDGKKGLILNIANDRSIAWHIANNAVKQGAKVGLGFLPVDNIQKSERRCRRAMTSSARSARRWPPWATARRGRWRRPRWDVNDVKDVKGGQP